MHGTLMLEYIVSGLTAAGSLVGALIIMLTISQNENNAKGRARNDPLA
jgi:hypothetical protein